MKMSDENTSASGRKVDVICLGQAVIDCITRGAEDAAASKKSAMQAESIRLSTGGDAVNEAFVLAELGHDAALVCCVGEDPAGALLLSEAKRRGVDTDRISVIRGLDTPIANLMVAGDGSRRSYNSRATMLPGYSPDPSTVRGARIVSLASLFRAPLDRPEVIRELAETAHDSGAILCADTKLPTFRKTALSELSDVLPLIDYLFPNEREAAYYTGESEYPEMAKSLLDLGVKHVVIKTGPEGCFAADAKEAFCIPARPVKAVDTTGAGDNFVAGFLSGLLKEESFRGCCERGMDTAARSVQHMGAVLPTEDFAL